MNALLQITLVNAACAGGLALVVALTARYVKRPAVIHTLWILVLLQLLMPPVFEVGLLPRPAPAEAAQLAEPTSAPSVLEAGSALTYDHESIAVATVATGATRGNESASAPAIGRIRPGTLATTIWVAGTVWVLGLVLARIRRFRRLLRAGASEDPLLDRRLARIAGRMAVRKPRLRLVRSSISPLIRPRFGGAELLFPSGLLNRLTAGEQEAILAHELAHIARRDHWVRLLELIAISLFWWHPAVWWARSRLRLAEERCCDLLVLQTLPRGRSSYARGLLKTVEFLAGTKAGVPALASGVGEVHDLKERLTMILKDRPPKSMSRIQKTLLALCAASVLLVFPTWSEQDLQAAPSDDSTTETQQETALAEAEREYVNQRLELEERALELEYALREVRERQAELEHIWQSEMRAVEVQELESEMARQKADGMQDRARELYERSRELSRAAEREQREHARDEARGRRQADVEYTLQHALVELERALQEGDTDRAADLRQEIAQLEDHVRESQIAYELARSRAEQDRVEADLERLRIEARLQREAGATEEADELEAEIEMLRERRLEERILRELEIQRLLEEIDRKRAAGGTLVR